MVDEIMVCPFMSKPVKGSKGFELFKAECLGEDCAVWNVNDEMCGVKSNYTSISGTIDANCHGT